jgi:hypothetical protein
MAYSYSNDTMKRKTQFHFVTLSILAFIIFSSCEVPLECDVGTTGISASFTDRGSLRTLEQGISSPIVVSILNTGSSPSSGFVRLGYNQDLIEAEDSTYEFSDLLGKESWNRCQGQEERLRFTAKPYPLPIATQKFETDLTLDVCYEYATNFSTTVCVDPRSQAINILDPNCVPQERQFAGGQGGPLGIVRVAAPVYQDDGTARIRFTLQNFGDGRIVSARTDDLTESCSIRSDIYENYIIVTGFLDTHELECTELNPGFSLSPVWVSEQGLNFEKTFLRPDPERIETRDGVVTLNTFTFICTASDIDTERELDMQVNLELAYFYRDTRSDSITTELRKI